MAEHAPVGRRGYYTSWIQTTATLGLFVSLSVILFTRHSLDVDPAVSIAKFNAWGWRIPFLFSIVLVGVSIYIRLKMQESPLFSKLKSEGAISANPLKESFGHKENLKMVLLALFGATMGQGVVWYTGQFYAQSFIENVCKIDFDQSRTILIWAILFGTPLFVVFGSWSDKIGRKWIMLVGMFLAVITYKPLFKGLLELSDTAIKTEVVAAATSKINSVSIPNSQNFVRTALATKSYTDGTIVTTTTTDTLYANPAQTTVKPVVKISKVLANGVYWKMVLIVFIMIVYVTMVYGPIAAFLVELFPTKIRYTSMSLPYHIGNGVFGGLTPFIATLLTTMYTADALAGLQYPIIVAAVSVIIGTLYLDSKINTQHD